MTVNMPLFYVGKKTSCYVRQAVKKECDGSFTVQTYIGTRMHDEIKANEGDVDLCLRYTESLKAPRN